MHASYRPFRRPIGLYSFLKAYLLQSSFTSSGFKAIYSLAISRFRSILLTTHDSQRNLYIIGLAKKFFLAFLLHRKPKLIFGQLNMICLLHSQLFIHVIPVSNTVHVSLPLCAVTCVIQSVACASFFYVREG